MNVQDMKPELKITTKSYVEYRDMVEYIKDKYGIDERDYAGCDAHIGNDITMWKQWLIDEHGKTYEELFAELTNCHALWSTKYSMEQIPGYVKVDLPHQDFWCWLLDNILPDNVRGIITEINWQEILELIDDEDVEVSDTKWEREIVLLYVAEFGNTDYNIHIDW